MFIQELLNPISGHGTMGISTSIGSNVFDVLLCLGLPWFIKAAFYPKIPGTSHVQINSEGMVYSSVSLFSTLIILYLAFYFNKFRLDRKVGLTCLITYGIFLVFASLTELNVFFDVNRPTCVHWQYLKALRPFVSLWRWLDPRFRYFQSVIVLGIYMLIIVRKLGRVVMSKLRQINCLLLIIGHYRMTKLKTFLFRFVKLVQKHISFQKVLFFNY